MSIYLYAIQTQSGSIANDLIFGEYQTGQHVHYYKLMLYINIKIALRNLFKNKAYAFINIGGLAIGLAACLAIGLYVADEYSYDHFHQNFDHIYRITEIQKQADGLHPVAVTPGPLAPALEKDFAEIIRTTRVGNWRALLQTGQKSIEPTSTLIVENSFFKMFDFKLLLGNPETVFLNPDELIISESLAVQFFGKDWRNTLVLGTTVMLNTSIPTTLAGVVENVPEYSHLQFDALLPFKYLEKYDEWSNRWNSNNYHTYLQLAPETNAAAFEEKISTQIARYDNGNDAILRLQPLSDIYLHSKFDFETDFGKRSDIFYVQVLVAVGLIVLMIAMVNFINLSTSRSTGRAREVGVRKSVGARRQSLITQFLSESLLMTTLAVGLSLFLAEAALPLFNDVADKEMVIPFWSPDFWLLILGTTVFIGLLAGMYPAFFLSAFQPSKVLKGIFKDRSGAGFRKMLVVGQFTLSVALGIATIVIYQQLNFMQNKNLGFDQSQLMFLRLKGDTRNQSALLKEELSKLPEVATVTATTNNLVDVSNSSNIEWEGQTAENEFLITQMNIDADFLKTTGAQMVSGRNFSPAIPGDTTDVSGRFIVNETAAKQMGYTNESALGKKVKFWGLEGEVIGVLKDFHFRPLSKVIEPFIFRFRPKEPYFNMLIKTNSGDMPGTIAAIEKVYKKIDTNNPVTYGFVDQDLEAQYRAEQRTGSIVLYFSILAVLISCLGLFGLAAFTAEDRTKEIGIRKVLGASVTGITGLLAKDFLKLVLLAILIASPVAWFFMQQWLADFAYRIEVKWWMFAGAGFVAVLVAFATVSFQSIKAALANPVKSLRSE